MRKTIFAVNISIDGGYDHTIFSPAEEVMEYFTALLKRADCSVYGRKMYELMFPYWSDVARDQSGTAAENEFADTLMSLDKVLFTKTLESTPENAKICRGNLIEEVSRLKQQPGKDILIDGMTIRAQLMEAGLIDEFYFLVHPLIAGKGHGLLEDFASSPMVSLKLVDSKVFASGSVALHYIKQ